MAFAVCDGTATDEQIGRVEAILTGDPAAALAYLECLDLHFDLERRGQRSGLDRRAVERIGSGLPTELHAAAISDRSDNGRSQLCPSPRLPTSSSFISRPSPFLLDHVGALAGVLSCYLAIAMMFGAGLFAAWTWTISDRFAWRPTLQFDARTGLMAHGRQRRHPRPCNGASARSPGWAVRVARSGDCSPD